MHSSEGSAAGGGTPENWLLLRRGPSPLDTSRLVGQKGRRVRDPPQSIQVSTRVRGGPICQTGWIGRSSRVHARSLGARSFSSTRIQVDEIDARGHWSSAAGHSHGRALSRAHSRRSRLTSTCGPELLDGHSRSPGAARVSGTQVRLGGPSAGAVYSDGSWPRTGPCSFRDRRGCRRSGARWAASLAYRGCPPCPGCPRGGVGIGSALLRGMTGHVRALR